MAQSSINPVVRPTPEPSNELAITPVQRLYHLDAARALLLLLGLPFHVATKAIFESEPAALAFQTSQAVGGYLSFTHIFRMFAFFMLAGYFAGMMRERKGAGVWLRERVRRLGLPLMASLATLGILQFRLQDLLLHKPSPRFLGLPLALDHLWFLIVLLGYCACYAAIPVQRIKPGRRILRALQLEGSGTFAMMLVLAGWGVLRIISELWVPPIADAPIETLLWQQFLFHAVGFVAGILAWHGRIGDRVFAMNRWFIWPAIVLMLIVFMPLDPLIRPALGKEIYPDGTGLWIMRTMELPLAYLMSLALFRMLAWAVNKQSRTVTFFVDGALAIYLFHLVWAMILLPQARALPISPELQWLVTSIMVLAISSLGYLVVRANNITSILFCGVPQKS